MSGESLSYTHQQEHLRLLAALRESEMLRELAELLASSLDLKHILQVLVKRTTEVCEVERCAVWLLEEAEGIFRPATYHLSSQHLNIDSIQAAETIWYRSPLPFDDPVIHRLMKENGMFFLEDLHAEASMQSVAETFLVRSVLLIALIREGRLVGMMSLDDPHKARTFSAELQQMARSIGQQAAVAIDNARLYQQAQSERLRGEQLAIEKAQLLAAEQARWQQEAISARNSEAAMREANMLKDEFLAITAHEFRTPLTVILAHSQMALRALRRAVDQEAAGEHTQSLVENLTTIEEQTRQLTNIVNTFLEVTQINRGQLTLKLEEVDLCDLAEQVVSDHSATSIDHTISCFVESREQPCIVMGDRARLRQIIANLVQNAIKYSPLGGPVTLRLCHYINREGKRVIEVCIEDKGIGVPKDAQARLFERFYRAPNSQDSKSRGIGLGLYVVAQLVSMHGGVIRVESNGVSGEGSRFIFTLPAYRLA